MYIPKGTEDMGVLHVQETTKKFDYLDNCFIITKLLLGNIRLISNYLCFKLNTKPFFLSISFPSMLTFR